MYMKNVQITIDAATLTAVDRAAKPLGLKRSAVVREALRAWLRQRAVGQFEEQWIARLREHADDGARAEDWLAIQTWSRK
jgi:metal-responsive CopG/Arc/MetJ family transcriptional regulator